MKKSNYKVVSVTLKAMEDDRVTAKNNRIKNRYNWEEGLVHSVSVGIRKDGGYHTQYNVLLDRKTTGRSRMFPDGGAPIFVTVGDNGIQKI